MAFGMWRILASLLAVVLPAPSALAQAYGPPPSSWTAYWDVPAFADHPYKGPDKARGVLFWSHGVSGKLPQYDSPPPDLIRDFARAGWDVVKIQRNNTHENGWSASGPRHVADLVARIEKAHGDGYRRIVAAGQSYGGAISLEAASATDRLFAVIAMAPGHGSDACGPSAGASSARIADTLQARLATAIRAVRTPRVVMMMADGDECMGFNNPTPVLRAALTTLSGSFVFLDASMPVRGHGAAYTPQFRRWYGNCLAAFLDPDRHPVPGETRCSPPDTVPRFFLDALPAPPKPAPGGRVGLWSGSLDSTSTSIDYGREICVAIPESGQGRLRALLAFGAGPERKAAMTQFWRDFEPEGDGFAHRGNQSYRIALRHRRDDGMELEITSANGRNVWTASLTRGC